MKKKIIGSAALAVTSRFPATWRESSFRYIGLPEKLIMDSDSAVASNVERWA
jgi:hypothetical protein